MNTAKYVVQHINKLGRSIYISYICIVIKKEKQFKTKHYEDNLLFYTERKTSNVG